jgi:hypothetical protein
MQYSSTTCDLLLLSRLSAKNIARIVNKVIRNLAFISKLAATSYYSLLNPWTKGFVIIHINLCCFCCFKGKTQTKDTNKKKFLV